ncbi:S8 family peptidase [Aquimarina gracilis]|uniref:S8 family peptidase n=1 Tax=Aquimarina gracilis TaxID=874422 RepID=A0ABU6A116_9FLAO|nr:S8 family peptidase [Aquimarina gracilis]MEB3347807.1 S8 family peptidase [Aquimarina gracilis]
MALSKRILTVVSASAILASCGAPAIISTPIENIDSVPLKNSELTEDQLKSWAFSDLVTDTIPGMSIDKAYNEIIKNRKGQTVIVGVIDSGVDIEHEDLKNVIWINTKEIKGNGKDDDNNGYVDDVYGWNFLGDTECENLEFTRIMKKLKPKYEGKFLSSVAEEDKGEYQNYIEAKAEFEKEYQETSSNKFQYEQILQQTKVSHESVTSILGKENYTHKELMQLETEDKEVEYHMAFLSQMFSFLEPGDTIPEFIEAITSDLGIFEEKLSCDLNLELNARKNVGDNVDDIKDVGYGNNNVMGPDSTKKGIKHGTHVAGIIAAERNNGIGMNGVAKNVKIMAVRAVPNGDEYDKDIALAIRYAVDNGAEVINTSFGKYFSTHPEWVREAIKYAASKDVLIVNAAGNETEDLDQKAVYPNDQFDQEPEVANNFITIGALNFEYGSNLAAPFSNYGKNNVDAFAPGVEIWATTPNNSYDFLDGTSMAAPTVAGVAALIRSYYPKLKAFEVKKILMDSGLNTKTDVVIGRDPNKIKSFSELSKSGKMVNLYNALIMADKMSK